ncbi:MAG: hypothetical protein ACRDKE_03530, partial [Solirubrobacterales bacterium]
PEPEIIPEPEPERAPEPEPERAPEPEPEIVPDPEPVPPTPPTEAPSLEVVEASWDKAVGTLLEESPSLASVLENSKPLRVEGRTLVIGFPVSASFYRKNAEQSDKREMILNHLTGATGFRFALQTEQMADAEFNPLMVANDGSGLDAKELVTQLKEGFDATEVARTAEAD